MNATGGEVAVRLGRFGFEDTVQRLRRRLVARHGIAPQDLAGLSGLARIVEDAVDG
jgi:hypothetical protein